MIKVFISQPMNAKSEEEIKAVRQEAIDTIEAAYPTEEIQIIDNYFEDYSPEIEYDDSETFHVPVKYLAKSIELLTFANLAYFCEGWEYARGCKIEHEVCTAYGITVMEKEVA